MLMSSLARNSGLNVIHISSIMLRFCMFTPLRENFCGKRHALRIAFVVTVLRNGRSIPISFSTQVLKFWNIWKVLLLAAMKYIQDFLWDSGRNWKCLDVWRDSCVVLLSEIGHEIGSSKLLEASGMVAVTDCYDLFIVIVIKHEKSIVLENEDMLSICELAYRNEVMFQSWDVENFLQLYRFWAGWYSSQTGSTYWVRDTIVISIVI